MSIKDEYIRNKYYNFIKENQIEIVSDIFERMDTDRRLKDELKQLQLNAEKQGKAFDLSQFLMKKKAVQKEKEKEAKTKKDLQKMRRTGMKKRQDMSESDDSDDAEVRWTKAEQTAVEFVSSEIC